MKLSLASQIAEIDRELCSRKLVYPRLVHSSAMPQSLADFQIAALTAAREELLWLQANELTIKQRLAP